jgi:hypothetical protein
MRKRILLILATIAAVAGFAIPASASSHLYETYNSTVYLGTVGTVLYDDAVTVNSPGRDLTLTNTGKTFSDPNALCPINGCPIYSFVLNSGFCIGDNNTYSEVEIRNCEGTLEQWALLGSSPTDNARWLNVAATNFYGFDQVLDGYSTTGLDIITCNYNSCPSGNFSRWSAV